MPIRFWRPSTPSVTTMFRVEDEERTKTTYAEHFAIVIVESGAFDAWHRARMQSHVAGSLCVKEPDEIHRYVRVHRRFTAQGALLAPAVVAEAAARLGLRGPLHFHKPSPRATTLAFAMHDALVRDDATEIERGTLVTETLSELLCTTPSLRAPRAVRRARAFLHDAIADKITLDDLAEHAALDKFHLVRAFRNEVGVPPYEYLTHLRVTRAKRLLRRRVAVADVAQAVGFYDQSQLHRHFRRIVGVPPGVYARSFHERLRTSARHDSFG